MLVQGLPPIIGDDAKVLILGTMPGKESLAKREYYANPRNAFWRIMEPYSGRPQAPYEGRCDRLKGVGIALWDVLLECERDGSSDTSISRPVPNAISALLGNHPKLRQIIFNGQGARIYFDQFGMAFAELGLITLPSTSPANARPGKLEAWREHLARIL